MDVLTTLDTFSESLKKMFPPRAVIVTNVFGFFTQDPEAFAASHDHWLQGGMYRSWKQLQLNTTGEAHVGAHA